MEAVEDRKDSEYTHFEIKGVITPDKIACTKQPVQLAGVQTTKELDRTTCQPCRMAMIHRAQMHMNGMKTQEPG